MSSDILDVLNIQQREASKKKQKVAEPKVKRMLGRVKIVMDF